MASISTIVSKTKPATIRNSACEFSCVALLLQGGGALGAYQAGVFQALFEAKLEPNWIAGVSIGAINSAIIAGNAPEKRLEKLREFWEFVTADAFRYTPDAVCQLLTGNDTQRRALSEMSALRSILFGIPGFFTPRMVNPLLMTPGSDASISYCDTAPLKVTLEKMIDFDRINRREMYFKVGAVNVRSGDFTDFDNEDTVITAEHVMASGALPPGFPPVEINGESYWDGGLISNTPLQWFSTKTLHDTLIFQIDLWSASGEYPKNMLELATRQKDIQYSSRTRANTDQFRDHHALRHAIAVMLAELPEHLKQLPEMKLLEANADDKVYNIIHLIYHNTSYEGYVKDVEFSRLSMEAHWKSGYDDTRKALANPEVLKHPANKEGIGIYDFSRTDRQAESPLAKTA